jgi:multiple sugar transport system ATP-binding protein
MDEPLSNLDAKLRVQTRAELIKLHRQLGITTIYVTHDQVEAMTMGDRIAVMRDGLIQQVDTPMGLYNTPVNMFVAGFIGTPSMNFLDATIVKNGDRFVVDAGSFKVVIPKDKSAKGIESYVGKTVVFGIRPEDIFDKAISSLVAPTDENTIKATVDVIEPMGAVVTAYVESGGHNITATLDAETKAKEDKEIELVFDMDKTHLFDKETEQAIF